MFSTNILHDNKFRTILICRKLWIQSVAKRVTEQTDDISKEEWDKIDDFLRTVYSAGEDMKVISKNSIFDPTKKAKAEEDIKLLQKVVQAGQGPVSKKDAAGFGTVASKADDLFEDFLDLLRDVPDEIWSVHDMFRTPIPSCIKIKCVTLDDAIFLRQESDAFNQEWRE